MGGPVAVLAEVAGGGHNAPPEVLLPDAVDHHPGGERILRAGNPFGQRHPPAPRGVLAVAIGLQHGRREVSGDGAGEPRLDGFPGLAVVSSLQHPGERDSGTQGRADHVGHRQGQRPPAQQSAPQHLHGVGEFQMALLLLASEVLRRSIHPAGFSPDVGHRQLPEARQGIGDLVGIGLGQLLQKLPFVTGECLMVYLFLRARGPLLQAGIFSFFQGRKDLLFLPRQFQVQVLGGEFLRGSLCDLLGN